MQSIVIPNWFNKHTINWYGVGLIRDVALSLFFVLVEKLISIHEKEQIIGASDDYG